MSTFNDPNREAVGQPPIWTGVSSEPKAEPEEAKPAGRAIGEKPAEAEKFDPGEHTVAEVQAYIEANPDDEKRVRRVEAKGKARASLSG